MKEGTDLFEPWELRNGGEVSGSMSDKRSENVLAAEPCLKMLYVMDGEALKNK